MASNSGLGDTPQTEGSENSDLFEQDSEMSLKEWRAEVLMETICQMMFVSGETAEPSAETTGMIEEIVHAQVVEMVRTEIIQL